MAGEDNVKAIRDYLEGEFSGCSIEDSHDSERGAHNFKIVFEGKTYLTAVSDAFLKDHSATDIPEKLRRYTLAEHLRELPGTPVLATNAGLQLEYE